MKKLTAIGQSRLLNKLARAWIEASGGGIIDDGENETVLEFTHEDQLGDDRHELDRIGCTLDDLNLAISILVEKGYRG